MKEMTPYQRFVHLSKYSRWNYELNRREHWEETVDRWWNWMVTNVPSLGNRLDIRQGVLDHEILPSMRALATAGPAADRDNTCIYNCSYLELASPTKLKELLFILMNGTGVGFSVESRVVNRWPKLTRKILSSNRKIVVQDSKEGWATAWGELLDALLEGESPIMDLGEVRPQGSVLRTFGGRASGPGPLNNLFTYTHNLFLDRSLDGKLTSVDLHKLACKAASAVVVGGVRRSAMISLSDLNDTPMRNLKTGEWWKEFPDLRYANNSAVYERKPSVMDFMDEWQSLYRSYSGERGIFNRQAATLKAVQSGRHPGVLYGTNPCGEILLRPNQFCNLTEVVLRPELSFQEIKRRVEMATVLGTAQASLTYFPFLGPEWKQNTEEERLLGVSFTGICDSPLMRGTTSCPLHDTLCLLRETAKEVNHQWSNELCIPPSKSITCVKPSGTASSLVNTSNGIHPRWSKYYIRRARMDIKDPLCKMMIDQGVPGEPENDNPNGYIFSFPQCAKYSLTKENVGTIAQVDLWDTYMTYWCDHNPSTTVYYTDETFLKLGEWVYSNWNTVVGMAFLPADNHKYAQAPYEEISMEEYDRLSKNFPVVNWDELTKYEKEDRTTATSEFACVGGQCDLT